VRLPDDHIVDHDHGTHRHLAGPETYPRLGERRAHEPFSVHLTYGLSVAGVWSATSGATGPGTA